MKIRKTCGGKKWSRNFLGKVSLENEEKKHCQLKSLGFHIFSQGAHHRMESSSPASQKHCSDFWNPSAASRPEKLSRRAMLCRLTKQFQFWWDLLESHSQQQSLVALSSISCTKVQASRIRMGITVKECGFSQKVVLALELRGLVALSSRLMISS